GAAWPSGLPRDTKPFGKAWGCEKTGLGHACGTRRNCQSKVGPHSRPACIINSMTFLPLSLERSTVGASSSASGTSLGLDSAPTPTAYSYALPVRRMSWPPLPVIHFRNACACDACLLDANTPPPDTLTKAPGSRLRK